MMVDALLRVPPSHLHWCHGCDTAWACDHSLLDCPELSAADSLAHCDRALPENKL